MSPNQKFTDLRNSLESISVVSGVIKDETYCPPHKQAGLVPYDAIIVVSDHQNVTWDKVTARIILNGIDFEYERITGVTENDTKIDGDYAVFVSIESPNW